MRKNCGQEGEIASRPAFVLLLCVALPLLTIIPIERRRKLASHLIPPGLCVVPVPAIQEALIEATLEDQTALMLRFPRENDE